MRKADYHLHSEFSFDSREKIENICVSAVENGIDEIVLTDHVEFPRGDAFPWPDYAARTAVIEACRKQYAGRLLIKTGVELGGGWRDIEGEAALLREQSFDFVLGSVHYPDGVPEAKGYTFTAENVIPYYDNYLRQLKKMAAVCDYDCLGHVTYLFRFVPEELVPVCNPYLYKKDYLELFEIVVSRGKGIEVNCSGLRMPTVRETLPSLEILRWYRSCGGTIVTVGSDGHSVRSAFSGLEEGYANLRAAGFDRAARFTARSLSFETL